jgi:hypothetical protein
MVLLMSVAAALAGCDSSPTPSENGKDALGFPIYSVSGGSLSALELAANSSCPGGTRPYYRDFGGKGGDTSISYTCE